MSYFPPPPHVVVAVAAVAVQLPGLEAILLKETACGLIPVILSVRV